MAAELHADLTSGHNVVFTVFVERTCGYRPVGPEAFRPVGENRCVEEATGEAPDSKIALAAGIVGFADLSLGDRVRPVLEAHLEASGRFRGIRHACSWDPSPAIRNAHTNPPPRLYLDAAFRKGFAHLAPLGLSFDAWLYHPQIPELTDLARAFPDTALVLDHVGGPLGIGPYAGQRETVVPEWKAAIDALALCPNVCVKLGGLVMPANGFRWHKQPEPPGSERLAGVLEPYFHYCIERFGPDRCMFESNFPVDKVSCSYNVLWNAFKRLASGFSTEEKTALFHDTAARFYRL